MRARISFFSVFVFVFAACTAEDLGTIDQPPAQRGGGPPTVTEPLAGTTGGDPFLATSGTSGGGSRTETIGTAGISGAGSGGEIDVVDASDPSDSNTTMAIEDAGVDGSGQGGIDAGATGGSGGTGGTGGTGGMDGTGGTGGSVSGPEPGRMVGITAAHNAVRDTVDTEPPLEPLTWSDTIATYAQEWADSLAISCRPQHRSSGELRLVGYGENIASFGSSRTPVSTAQRAVEGWAEEAECWTYGQFMSTDQCDAACYLALNSDGCGHYTQIVWRDTQEVGCGVSTCTSGGMTFDLWVCNYSPPGNHIMNYPY
jgi:pathogenesis-related protein 1